MCRVGKSEWAFPFVPYKGVEGPAQERPLASERFCTI